MQELAAVRTSRQSGEARSRPAWKQDSRPGGQRGKVEAARLVRSSQSRQGAAQSEWCFDRGGDVTHTPTNSGELLGVTFFVF